MSVSAFRGYLLSVEDYRVVGGSRRWGTSCTYDFFSTDDVTSGRFFSEKFPQNYPPSLSCSYLFVSSADQVVSVTFSSIRLAIAHQHQQQQQQQQDLDVSRSVWGQLCSTSSTELRCCVKPTKTGTKVIWQRRNRCGNSTQLLVCIRQVAAQDWRSGGSLQQYCMYWMGVQISPSSRWSKTPI